MAKASNDAVTQEVGDGSQDYLEISSKLLMKEDKREALPLKAA